MRILMVTNTYLPHVGGVARSVQQFSQDHREHGHDVLVIAPEFPRMPPHEEHVLRVPAVQNFNGSDFSVPVPPSMQVIRAVADFRPQIVHSHHPFLLGDTAMRLAATHDVPLVFTHHTQYERYTHYVPGDSPAMKQFVIDLSVGYCNLCDAVIAPSRSILDRLVGQGVATELHEIPTGVNLQSFAHGSGERFRARQGISPDQFVVGHVGRLAPEKGIDFMISAVVEFLNDVPNGVLVVAGSGPAEGMIRQAMASPHLRDRLIMLGTLPPEDLADVYAAMDVFVFASQSETQGMVLTEAMAGGTPLVAVDAPGVREVLIDQQNGCKLESASQHAFARAIDSIRLGSPEQRASWRQGALETAERLSLPRTAEQTRIVYEKLVEQGRSGPHGDDVWSTTRRRLGQEWQLMSNVLSAATHAFLGL